MRISVRSVLSRVMLGGAAALVVSGCENPVTNEALDAPFQILDEVTLSEFRSQLSTGGVRVEITVDSERPLARRIEIQLPEALRDEEAITSKLIGIELEEGGGHLTLALGDLRVGFNRDTRFEIPGGEDVSMELFVARVSAALTEGAMPPIMVEREPGDVPQSPNDEVFDAHRIKLLHEQERPQIEITIDMDNLARNEDPPPDGWITVLGLRLEIRVTEGLTEITHERPDLEKMEFEGVVSSVDLHAAAFTLEDGTVIKLVAASDLHHGEQIPRLERLAHVAQALEVGLTIVAHGVGAVESREPLVLVALRLAFTVRSGDVIEFRGAVASVSVERLAFELGDGTLIRLLDITHISGGGDPGEALARAFAALEAGNDVFVHGAGIEVEDEPRVIVALKLEFGASVPLEEFRGEVRTVDESERVVTLHDGTVIQLTENTTIHHSDDRHVLGSLEEVRRAIEAGATVLVKGLGTVQSEDPLIIEALRIVFVVEPPRLDDFRGHVAAVDVSEHLVRLDDGTVVRLDDNTTIHDETDITHSLPSLEAVARALDAGLTVVAAGLGVVENRDPLVILARDIVFVAKDPNLERFEGVVVRVSVTEGEVGLEDGTIIVMTGDTKFYQSDDRILLGSLEEVAGALEAGEKVVTVGIGVVTSEDPRTIEAVRVAFVVRLAPIEFFEGSVASVDVEEGLVTLGSGLLIKVIADTEIVDSDHGLPSLEAVSTVLSEGDAVVAAGIGHVVGFDPPLIVAIEVLFVIAVP